MSLGQDYNGLPGHGQPFLEVVTAGMPNAKFFPLKKGALMLSSHLDRRRFLAASVAAATISTLAHQATGRCDAQTAVQGTPPPVSAKDSVPQSGSPKQELFKISLAQWSLHRALRAGEIDNLDFARVAKEDFGIDAIEYVNSFFFKKAKDQKYLRQMKQRSDDLGVQTLLIMVDREGQIGDPDDQKRSQCVDRHRKWIDAAKFLGCHSIRVNAASAGGYQQQVGYAADGLAKLSQFAAKSGLNVLVENHGGLSSNGQWLAQVIRKVDMKNCGTLPDFGNFTITPGDADAPEIVYDRYLGMASLMPFAKAVSAKSYDFDEGGNETKIDFLSMLSIMVDAGYDGHVGIEYGGKRLGEMGGIAATQKLLFSCREKLAATPRWSAS